MTATTLLLVKGNFVVVISCTICFFKLLKPGCKLGYSVSNLFTRIFTHWGLTLGLQYVSLAPHS